MQALVAIVDGDSGFAEGLRRLLDESPEFRCSAVCASAEEAWSVLPAQHPHVVLANLDLPKASGVECIRRLRGLLPEADFLMLSTSADYEHVYQSLKAGATGYLLKPSLPSELLAAVRELRAGGAPLSGPVARKVVDAFRQFVPPTSKVDCLSSRENEVLHALASGRRYKEVAELLGITYDTVRTHAHNIYKKLRVHSLDQAGRKLHRESSTPKFRVRSSR